MLERNYIPTNQEISGYPLILTPTNKNYFYSTLYTNFLDKMFWKPDMWLNLQKKDNDRSLIHLCATVYARINAIYIIHFFGSKWIAIFFLKRCLKLNFSSLTYTYTCKYDIIYLSELCDTDNLWIELMLNNAYVYI